MKLSSGAVTVFAVATTAASVNGYSFIQPMRIVPPAIRNAGTSSLKMISTGDDRSERKSLDISKTTYSALVKAPKDAYIAVSPTLSIVLVVDRLSNGNLVCVCNMLLFRFVTLGSYSIAVTSYNPW
jgi:hypothetical protein